jgi:hypothetical protein
LRNVVQTAIEGGRIGSPRFLRCLARTRDRRQIASSLDDLVALGEVWFGSRPRQRYRLGEDDGAYLTEFVRWSEGQAALLIVSLAAADGPPALDLMLVGSRGTLYHDEPYSA